MNCVPVFQMTERSLLTISSLLIIGFPKLHFIRYHKCFATSECLGFYETFTFTKTQEAEEVNAV